MKYEDKITRRSFFKGSLVGLAAVVTSFFLKKIGLALDEPRSIEPNLKEPEYNKSEYFPGGYWKPTQKQLHEWYISERNTARQIAKKIDVSTATVHKWLRAYSIPIRKSS